MVKRTNTLIEALEKSRYWLQCDDADMQFSCEILIEQEANRQNSLMQQTDCT